MYVRVAHAEHLRWDRRVAIEVVPGWMCEIKWNKSTISSRYTPWWRWVLLCRRSLRYHLATESFYYWRHLRNCCSNWELTLLLQNLQTSSSGLLLFFLNRLSPRDNLLRMKRSRSINTFLLLIESFLQRSALVRGSHLPIQSSALRATLPSIQTIALTTLNKHR